MDRRLGIEKSGINWQTWELRMSLEPSINLLKLMVNVGENPPNLFFELTNFVLNREKSCTEKDRVYEDITPEVTGSPSSTLEMLSKELLFNP